VLTAALRYIEMLTRQSVVSCPKRTPCDAASPAFMRVLVALQAWNNIVIAEYARGRLSASHIFLVSAH